MAHRHGCGLFWTVAGTVGLLAVRDPEDPVLDTLL